jgi:glycosidase
MLWGDDDTVKDPKGSDYDVKLQTNGTLNDQLLSETSLYNYYKRLIMIRRANPEMYLGTYEPLSFADTKAGGFIGEYQGTKVCVLHNTSGSSVTLDLSKVTEDTFTTVAASIGVDGLDATLEGSKVMIPAQTSVVLRK